MTYSTIGLPVKYFELNLDRNIKTYKTYEVTLRGIKGYGIDYGVIDAIPELSRQCSEKDLGATVLDLLKKSPKLWEDSIIKIIQL